MYTPTAFAPASGNVDIPDAASAAEIERQATVDELIPRERRQILRRDEAFDAWLKRKYREMAPQLSSQYRGAPHATVQASVYWLDDFEGVNKKDGILRIAKFDLATGQSWAYQHRAKGSVPLYICWFGAFESAIEHMRTVASVSDTQVKDMLDDLLDKNYRPQSDKAGQASLVCSGSLQDDRMLSVFDEIAGITYTPYKKQKNSEATSEVGSLSPEYLAVVTEREDALRECDTAWREVAELQKRLDNALREQVDARRTINDLQALVVEYETAMQNSPPDGNPHLNPLSFPIPPHFQAMGLAGYPSCDDLSGNGFLMFNGSPVVSDSLSPGVYGDDPMLGGSTGYLSSYDGSNGGVSTFGSSEFTFPSPDMNVGDVPMADAGQEWNVPFMYPPDEWGGPRGG